MISLERNIVGLNFIMKWFSLFENWVGPK